MGPPNNYGRTTDSTSSTILLKTQSSSTQTDMRDSEIQTDPWWYRSEGTIFSLPIVFPIAFLLFPKAINTFTKVTLCDRASFLACPTFLSWTAPMV